MEANSWFHLMKGMDRLLTAKQLWLVHEQLVKSILQTHKSSKYTQGH